MADTKTTGLTANSTPAAADLVVTIDDVAGTPVTKKTTVDELDDYLSASAKSLTGKTIAFASNTVTDTTDKRLMTDAQETKLDSVESSATADQTGAEIKTAYEAEADTNAYTDAEKVVVGNTSGTNTGDQTLSTKASLGLDTTDSPQFAGVNVGHASDTTLGRTSAGVANIEGSDIVVSGGALGTPSSGTLTNATGLPVGGIANGTDGELITWDASGVAATVAVGTATHVLTSNGVGVAPTFQAAAGGGGDTRVTNRFSMGRVASNTNVRADVGGSGAVADSNATGGVDVRTGTTSGSAAGIVCRSNNNGNVTLNWDDSPEFVCLAGIQTIPASHNGTMTITFGLNGPDYFPGGLAKTSKHMGFVADIVSGTIDTLASNANGTTQTTTDIDANITNTDSNWLRCIMDGTTDITFYVNSTVVATHTTNLASGAIGVDRNLFGLDNDSGETTDWQGRCGTIYESFKIA